MASGSSRFSGAGDNQQFLSGQQIDLQAAAEEGGWRPFQAQGTGVDLQFGGLPAQVVDV